MLVPRQVALWFPLLALVVLCVALFASLEFSPRNELPSPLINRPLPSFDLPDLKQAAQRTSHDLPEGAFLLNVWATWCLPCRNEHPVLLDIAAQGVQIVGLNYKDESDKAIEWLNNLGDPYGLNLVDAGGRYGIDLGIYGVPTTYIVDSARIIRYQHIGPITSKQWRQELRPVFRSLQQMNPSA